MDAACRRIPAVLAAPPGRKAMTRSRLLRDASMGCFTRASYIAVHDDFFAGMPHHPSIKIHCLRGEETEKPAS